MGTQIYKFEEHTVSFCVSEKTLLGNIVFLSPHFDYKVVREPIKSFTLIPEITFAGVEKPAPVIEDDNIFEIVESASFRIKIVGSCCILKIRTEYMTFELCMNRVQ